MQIGRPARFAGVGTRHGRIGESAREKIFIQAIVGIDWRLAWLPATDLWSEAYEERRCRKSG